MRNPGRLIGAVAIALAVLGCTRALDEAVVEVYPDRYVVADNGGTDVIVLLRQSGVTPNTAVTVRVRGQVPDSRFTATLRELEDFGLENIQVEYR